jgi:hypothetical protein
LSAPRRAASSLGYEELFRPDVEPRLEVKPRLELEPRVEAAPRLNAAAPRMPVMDVLSPLLQRHEQNQDQRGR